MKTSIMRTLWTFAILLAGAGAGFAQRTDEIYPRGLDANGLGRTAATLYSTVVAVASGGPYVPLAGGSAVGSAMTGTLYIGHAAALTSQYGIRVKSARPDTGQVTNDATISGENDSAQSATGARGFAIHGIKNFNGGAGAGAGVFGGGFNAPDAYGVEGQSEESAAGRFISGSDGNTSPTVVISLFDDGVDAQAASTHLLSIWTDPEDPESEIAYITGEGGIAGVVGALSTALYTPTVLSASAGNVDLTFAAAGTGAVILSDKVTMANAGPLTFTPAAAFVVDDAGDAIPSEAKLVKLDPASNITLADPNMVAGSSPEGTVIYITVPAGEANTVTFNDQSTSANSNMELGAATRVMGANDVLVVMFNGTDWVEVSYANN